MADNRIPNDVYTTEDVLSRLRPDSVVTRPMRGLADLLRSFAQGPEELPESKGKLARFLARAGAGGADTMANWLDRRPEIGPDTLAPMGLAALSPTIRAAAAARPVSAYSRFSGMREDTRAAIEAFERANPEHAVFSTPSPPATSSRPLMPAIMVDGKVWAGGPTHVDSMGLWTNDLYASGRRDIPDVDALMKAGRFIEGFTTADGRFLDRQQAAKHIGVKRGSHFLDDSGLETDWMREKGLLADSSRAALPGILVNGAEQAERPVQAAIKVGDKVFGGATHFDALRAAVPRAAERDLWDKELEKAFHAAHGVSWYDPAVAADGFVTNTGRFVDRKEAAKLATAADGYRPPFIMGQELDAVDYGKHLGYGRRGMANESGADAFGLSPLPPVTGRTLPSQVFDALDPVNPSRVKSQVGGFPLPSQQSPDDLASLLERYGPPR